MDGHDAPLRILLIDDSPADLALNIRALRDLGRPVVTDTVCTGPALRAALQAFSPDVILSDFSMPGFSGQEALAIAGELAPDIPFIYVSGTIGEELAIEAMQRGAVDYVLKDNLRRLPPAIDRALMGAERQRGHRAMQKALRESEERFRTLVENTRDWIWESDAAGCIVYSNGGVRGVLGLQPADVLGRPALDFIVDEDRSKVAAARAKHAADQRGWYGWITRWRHRDGSVRMLDSSAEAIVDDGGAFLGFRGIDRDVTLRFRQEERIQRQARVQAVLSAHGNAVLHAADADELLEETCRVAVEQGQFKAAVIGRRISEDLLGMSNYHGDARIIELIEAMGPVPLAPTTDPLVEQRPSVRAFRLGERIITPDYDNSDIPVTLRDAMRHAGVGAQIVLPIGRPPWAVLGLFSETPRHFDEDEIALLDRLTAQIDYARDFITKSERLQHMAYHHPVTGLPSRNAFAEAIVARLAQGRQVVVMADVVRFRHFNHSRGRAFGDRLLTAVGARLKSLVPEHALFCHPGDDAFLFAYPAGSGMATAMAEVEDVLAECCRAPFLVDGELVDVRLQAGVLMAPDHGDSADAVERNLAAVLAEARGSDQPVHAFTEALRLRSVTRASIERDLRDALARSEFELFLQPKFLAATQVLTGAEALIRWRHPSRGLVSPAEFIPLLEETGMILEVGSWVRREALAIWGHWRDKGHAGLRLAVNVSARELRHVSFVPDCAALLGSQGARHGLDIEITESMVMDDIDKSIRSLQALRSLGCRIAIDDFGTGYSSLNYLSRLPADTLKIDQSFVSALATSADTLALVTNIIGLAHSLGLKVVAEGVEDEEQAKLLRLLRCDELQGYHFGRPVPVADFERQYLG